MASDNSSSKQRSNFSILIASALVIFLGITAIQIYLNRPDTRAQVACYNLAVIHDIVWVSPIEIFAPDDVVWQLKNARDVQDTYQGCTEFLSRQNWLRKI